MTKGGTLFDYIIPDLTGANREEGAAIPPFLSISAAQQARTFHASIPDYQPTPLRRLTGLARHLGVKEVLVKDESKRFGLNAFKVLGGAYAIAQWLAQNYQLSLEQLRLDELQSALGEELAHITFVTATDGNHGRGVAWAARTLGANAVVYLPKGTAASRVRAISNLGANAIVTDLNYDEAVRLANTEAERNKWVLVQDTALPDYEQIPSWIMQGYLTMADEAWEQLLRVSVKPTHLFLQVGVGSMAASVLAYFRQRIASGLQVILMEPFQADCVYRSVKKADGQAHAVTGDLDTIMAGLACGEPNPLAWPILRDHSTAYFRLADSLAGRGVRILANPLFCDQRIVSGESAAVGVGLLAELMRAEHAVLQQRLGLSPDSVMLFFSTEGDTDPDSYRRIVWDCAH